ncbi:hypothetical protein ACFV4N_22010 [Actinosynnema sp. NPDC059797]
MVDLVVRVRCRMRSPRRSSGTSDTVETSTAVPKAPTPGERANGDDVRMRAHPGKVTRLSLWDWVVRFAFGAGVSAVTGVVAVAFGLRLGGLLPAFPPILPAGVALVAEHSGVRQAQDDMQGAVVVLGGYAVTRPGCDNRIGSVMCVPSGSLGAVAVTAPISQVRV